MKYTFTPKGVCAMKLSFDLDDGKISDIQFLGGCNGNLSAISKLAEGMDAERLVSILRGNKCGMKNTSCADQLAEAVELALEGKL